jgi:glycosyltransferase involved in cell wall biosynthesis
LQGIHPVNFEASIVIPLLNQADAWLNQAVVSALDQTARCEVLVVTSAETCNSNLEVLQRLSTDRTDLRVLRQPPGQQFAAALNLGIREASADRIGFLMSDDWLDPEAVAACLARSEDIVSTGRTFCAADGTTVLDQLTEVHTEMAFKALRTMADRATFLSHFFLIRRAALDRAGGVDETIGNTPGVDDFDLIWRMLEQGASVGIVPAALYNYRDHEDLRLTRRDRAEMLATFQRILDKHSLSSRERRRVLAIHSPWFGSSMRARYEELTPAVRLPLLLRQLQQVYRRAVPLPTRLSIHDRFLRWGGRAKAADSHRS